MNSIIESEKIERRRIRFTLVDNKFYAVLLSCGVIIDRTRNQYRRPAAYSLNPGRDGCCRDWNSNVIPRPFEFTKIKMNSVIESLNITERKRIRVTHMGGRMFYKVGSTWITTYTDGEFTIHEAPLPGFTVPHPKRPAHWR